jgi:hypothetical protein
MAYTWKKASGGSIPSGAKSNGKEADGTPLWVARASHAGGIHPGKVRPAFGAANIPYGGKEIKVTDYEVLMEEGRWVKASGGKVPDGAVVSGFEANGEPLFVARAAYKGGIHQGKVRLAFGAANIPYGGNEVKVPDYEVLVND